MDLREITEFFRDIMWYVIVFGIIIFILTFVIGIQTVTGNSMNPTLKDGQPVLVSRLSYKFKDIERNQIVVLNHDTKSYVKRIIGLPGEKIDYMDGILYIDDKPFKETYLNEDVETYNFMFKDVCDVSCPNGVIPEDKYLVMGDNRPESIDSRDSSFGLVDKKDIKGKVFYSIFPFKSIK